MPRYRQALPQLSDRLFVTDGGIETTLIFLNRRAIALIASFRLRPELQQREVVLSGNIGPRGDGYVPGAMMSVNQAADYHAEQITTFAATDADLVSAFTINYTEEAIGIARAAGWLGMPAVISFTVETDGKLPTGESLQAAIERTDLATDGYPAYYMINCAHPSHFQDALLPGSQWYGGRRSGSDGKDGNDGNDGTVATVPTADTVPTTTARPWPPDPPPPRHPRGRRR